MGAAWKKTISQSRLGKKSGSGALLLAPWNWSRSRSKKNYQELEVELLGKKNQEPQLLEKKVRSWSWSP